ncbi:hypothetical protein O3M35_004985 [Rhynocoris fuscipes]|uniref:MalT-like TPR region domain-containing protein n=1 Tax=Rhynocoris fuscipes TaxID=488301 RepID=A0AAW1DGL3_9HEMI
MYAAHFRSLEKIISKLQTHSAFRIYTFYHGIKNIFRRNIYSINEVKTSLQLYKVGFTLSTWRLILINPDSEEKGREKEAEWRKERLISHYISLAETAMKEGDILKAENLLEKALKVSDEIRTVGVTSVYEMLATIAFKSGKISEATQLLEEAIAKLTSSNSKEDKNMLINFSLKLARLYENEGKNDLAEMGFRNCIACQKNKYLSGSHDEETTALWINSLFWYGKFLAQKKRYSEAKQCFESAYLLIPHVKSIGQEQAMVTLYNMGEMSFATGDNETALKHLLNAVIIGKSFKSSDLPIYYNKIGLIYLHKGILNEAKRWCTNGLEASKRHYNKSIKKESEDCLREIERLNNKKNKPRKKDE